MLWCMLSVSVRTKYCQSTLLVGGGGGLGMRRSYLCMCHYLLLLALYLQYFLRPLQYRHLDAYTLKLSVAAVAAG